MISIVEAKNRHFEDFAWLKTYWLFSFDTYHDPDNRGFSILRVFNDDVIAPGTGFDMHPHRDMEIITIVLSGEVSHGDNMGNRTIVKAGEVQRMSAGRGVIHSEHNRAAQPLHLYQIWIHPDSKGLEPSYEQKNFARAATETNVPITLVSPKGNDPEAVHIHADAYIRMFNLEGGVTNTYSCSERSVFIYVISGELSLSGITLTPGDQARLSAEEDIILSAASSARILLIDLPPI